MKTSKFLTFLINLTSPVNRIELVNSFSMLLAAFAAFFGCLHYAITRELLVTCAAFLESVLLLCIYALNILGINRFCRHALMIVNTMAFVFFSAVLGSITEVHLLLFFFAGLALLIFDTFEERLTWFLIPVFGTIVCELNHFYQFVPSMVSLKYQYHTRWLSMPLIMTLIFIVIYLGYQAGIRRWIDICAALIHDTKSGVANIYHAVNFVYNSPCTNADMLNFAATINVVADNLSNILEDHHFGNSEQIEISYEYADIGVLINNILQRYEQDFKFRGIQVIFEAQSELLVKVNRNAVEKVLTNLINFSCRVTKRRLEIVAGWNSDMTLGISVFNDSTAITKADLANIFSPYYALKGRSKSESRGLYMVKHLVVAMGGKIYAEKHADGIRITFQIPAIGSVKGNYDNAKNVMIKTNRPRLLIMTSDNIQALYIKKIFPYYEWDVLETTSYQEAMQVAIVEKPHCVLFMVNINKSMRGLSSIREFSRHDITGKIPFIIVSKTTSKVDVNLSMDAGAIACVCLPGDRNKLVHLVSFLAQEKAK